MRWNDDDQYLFAAFPLQPHMASFPADNSESDLAENFKHISARDNWESTQGCTTLTTVTIGR